jgi:hypothetical protein
LAMLPSAEIGPTGQRDWTGTPGLPAIGHEDFVREAREATAGDAHAQKAAEKSAIEIGVETERTDNHVDFLLGFRRRNAPNAIEVAAEKIWTEKTNEKRHDFDFRMHGIPKNALLEVFLLMFKPGAKGGFKIVW